MSAQEWLDRADALAEKIGPAEGRWGVERLGAAVRAGTEALPQAVAALRAVLDLHQPVRNGILDSGSWTCAECLGYLGCRPSGPDHFCLTVRAITDALDGAS